MEENNLEYRSFEGIEENESLVYESNNIIKSGQSLIQVISENILGENNEFLGPYGNRPCIYADWTASGRLLQQIETYLYNEIYPLYGNTHTSTSRTGLQSTCYRHEARQIIAEAVNAKITGKAAIDLVLFTGNGTTSAVNTLVHCLGLNIPLPDPQNIDDRPVVFTSSYEHHSNLLPWREAEVDVVTIKFSSTTGVCLDHLISCLHQYQNRKLKIGAFSAASNVTGILTDVDALSIIMHKAGGLVFFDYATAAPYVKIDMNPVLINSPDAEYIYKDAIYFSGHKFIGGPGAPGVLIAKKRMLPSSKETPTTQGGGTVFYVTDDHHRYLSNRVEREEGGTPNIIGDIKLGLVVRLKQLVGVNVIHEREINIAKLAHTRLNNHPAIHLLGHPKDILNTTNNLPKAQHLPLISFLIQPSGCSRFLHHNFVSSLLNDLFGIQSRGGCMCAGPYAQWLLGIQNFVPLEFNTDNDEQITATTTTTNSSTTVISDAIENALLDKNEVIRPGFTRLSLPYFTSDEKIEYILKAIEFVADYGVLFLPYYRYNHKTGGYAHSTHHTKFPERKWLSRFDFMESTSVKNTPVQFSSESYETIYNQAVNEAKNILQYNLSKVNKLKSHNKTSSISDFDSSLSNYEKIRWFVVPTDFIGSLPIVQDGSSYSKQEIKGSIHPNLFFNNSSINNSYVNEIIDGLLTQNQTAYAQKRHEKLASRSANDSKFHARYTQPTSLVGIVSKESFLETEKQKILEKKVVTSNLLSNEKKNNIEEKKDELNSLKVTKTNETSNESIQGIVGEGILGGKSLSFISSENKDSDNNNNSNYNNDNSKSQGKSTNQQKKSIVPPKKILKLVGQAIGDWDMIEEGDRLLLGLSGGKDSLSLLHILLHIQKKAPVNFTIACATVDPQTESFDPSPLIPYVQSLGVTYHYLSEPIVEMAKSKLQGDSLCAFCARFKRGLLYSCCRNNNYNKLVLAQHLDDLAESFIMSSLHNGQIRTMKANYKAESDGIEVNVIRPLVYVREQYTRDFSLSEHLPVINENCPACFEQPKERARIKKLLSQEETMIPSLFNNIRKALMPLMSNDIYKVIDNITENIQNKVNNKNNHKNNHNNGNGNGSSVNNHGNNNKMKRKNNMIQETNNITTITPTTSLTPNLTVIDNNNNNNNNNINEEEVEEEVKGNQTKKMKYIVFENDNDNETNNFETKCENGYCIACNELGEED